MLTRLTRPGFGPSPGSAPANYNPPPYGDGHAGPNQPVPTAPWGESDGYAPSGISDTLILYHNGHETESCTPNYDGVVDHFNQLGYDVMELMMPMLGCNLIPPSMGQHTGHKWFKQFEEKGDYTMRYFIEPVALAAMHGRRLGYKHIALVGLSGGGWTTTVAAAVVPAITLSIPIAGSIPKWPTASWPHWLPSLPDGRNHSAVSPDIFHPAPSIGSGGDYEQWQERPMYAAVGGYLQLYVLGSLERGRCQVQILHEYDTCCFRGAGLFDEIRAYNLWAQAKLSARPNSGWFQTAVTAGNFHEVNPRDKVIIALLVERLRRKRAPLGREDFVTLPFDDLQVQ